MTRARLVVLCLFLGAVAAPRPGAAAQGPPEPDRKEQDARAHTQRLLDEPLIDSAAFQKPLPLTDFLAALEKRLPKDKHLKLQIDRAAFGDRQAEVAATPVALPAAPKTTSLRAALERAIAQCKVKADYRVGAAEVAVTTPAQARYTASYDVRQLVGPSAAADRAVRTIQALAAALDPPTRADRDAVQFLDGTRLVVHASAAEHARIAQLLHALHRAANLTVIVQASLYEVDDAFYTKLKNVKRVPLDELERQFLAGVAPKDDLFKLLAKAPLVLAGPRVVLDDGQQARLLARQRAVICRPGPDQVRQGNQTPQVVLEGVAVLGRVWISSDRRFVRVRLTEKAATLDDVAKVKVWRVADQNEFDAEVPFVQEDSFTRLREITDGGSLLVPVHYRPAALRAKGRWWVLSITARIRIPEEEAAAAAN